MIIQERREGRYPDEVVSGELVHSWLFPGPLRTNDEISRPEFKWGMDGATCARMVRRPRFLQGLAPQSGPLNFGSAKTWRGRHPFRQCNAVCCVSASFC